MEVISGLWSGKRVSSRPEPVFIANHWPRNKIRGDNAALMLSSRPLCRDRLFFVILEASADRIHAETVILEPKAIGSSEISND